MNLGSLFGVSTGVGCVEPASSGGRTRSAELVDFGGRWSRPARNLGIVSSEENPHAVPEWLPVQATQDDSGWWVVDLPGDEVTLGSVPHDGVVEFHVRRSPLRIDCEEQAPGSRLRFRTRADRTLTVGPRVREAEVVGVEFLVVTEGDCRIQVGDHSLFLAPGKIRGTHRNGELEVLEAVGLQQVRSSGSVTLAADGDQVVDVDIGTRLRFGRPGTISTYHLSGSAKQIDGFVPLVAGSDLRCSTFSTRSTVTGSTIHATSSLTAQQRVESSTLEVDAEEGGLAVMIGTAHEPPVELRVNDDGKLAGSPPPVGVDVADSVILVSGPGAVVAGNASDSKITTGGSVVLRGATGSVWLSAGNYIYASDAIEGDGFESSRVVAPLVHARDVDKCRVFDTERLFVVGSITTSCVEVTDRLRCGEAIRDSVATSTGSGHARTVTDSSITISGAGHFESVVETALTVGAGNLSECPVVRWTQSGDLLVDGKTRLTVVGEDGKQAAVDSGSTVLLDDGAMVSVLVAPRTPSVGNQRIEMPGAVHVEMGARADLTLAAAAEAVLEEAGEGCKVRCDGGALILNEELPTLALEVGGTVALRGKAHALSVAGGGTLELSTSTQIRELNVDGTVLRAEGGARVVALRGNFKVDSLIGYLHGDPTRPPVLLHCTASAGDRWGVLTNVDVTSLPFEDLQLLERFRVMDPSPAPILACARAVPRTSATATERSEIIRDRAQWFDELAARASGHSLTGASRSAIEWGRQYLHHQRLSVWSPERWVRFLHRLVGYGYRPSRALLTFLALTLAVALFSLGDGCPGSVREHGGDASVVRQYCVSGPANENLDDLAGAWISVMVAPARLVRLTDSASPLPYFPAPLDSLVNAAIGLAFIFLVLALRNYLRLDLKS